MTDGVHLYFNLFLKTDEDDTIIGELRHSHHEWFFERLHETRYIEAGYVISSTSFKEIFKAIESYIDDYTLDDPSIDEEDD